MPRANPIVAILVLAMLVAGCAGLPKWAVENAATAAGEIADAYPVEQTLIADSIGQGIEAMDAHLASLAEIGVHLDPTPSEYHIFIREALAEAGLGRIITQDVIEALRPQDGLEDKHYKLYLTKVVNELRE